MARVIPAGFEDDSEDDDFLLDRDDDGNDDVPYVENNSSSFQVTSPATSNVSNGFGRPPPGRNSAPSQHNQWSQGNRKKRERGDVIQDGKAQVIAIDDFRAAVRCGNVDATAQMLKAGVAVDIELSTGWTALMYAANNARADMVSMLLQHGANPNFACDMYTVLMAGCGSTAEEELDIVQCVSTLIDAGAQVNAFDRYHQTPLMYATKKNRSRVVKKLLELGAEPNKHDNKGSTPLMEAVRRGYISVVMVLLHNGADVLRQNQYGASAVDIAAEQGHDKILALLEKQVDPLRTKLVYTEDDLQELEAQDERDADGRGERTAPVATRSNLLAADYGSCVSAYGELEMFLAGLELGNLIPLFQEHHVTFADVLKMADSDLVKMGVVRMGERKKILDGIITIHKKDWQPSSLTANPVQYSRKITAQEALGMVMNLNNHLGYITSTVVIVREQVTADPDILLKAKEGAGVRELNSHTEEAMTHLRNLYQELCCLRTHTAKLQDDALYEPPDLIKPSTRRRKHASRSRLRSLITASVIVGVVGVCVWKADDAIKAVWKSS